MTRPPAGSHDDGRPPDDSPPPTLWVHGLLRGLADRADARAARLGEFSRRLTAEPAGRRPARSWWAGMALAAGVLAAVVLVGLPSGHARASAESLVRQALEAHQQPVDRCYRIEVRPEPGVELPPRAGETLLWTRGDRYLIKNLNACVAHGRDVDGVYWVARTPTHGVRFDADEVDVPNEWTLRWAVCSMKLETLLAELPRDFDLRREPHPIYGAMGEVITADLKPGHRHPFVHKVRLEIDQATHSARRVVLAGPLATATYTLVETGSLDEELYTLERHLEPGAKVVTRPLRP